MRSPSQRRLNVRYQACPTDHYYAYKKVHLETEKKTINKKKERRSHAKKSIREISEKNETRVVVAAWPNRAKRQVHVLRGLRDVVCIY